MLAKALADLSLDAVALYRQRHRFFGNRHTQPGVTERIGQNHHGQTAFVDALATCEGRLELRRPEQASAPQKARRHRCLA